MAGPIGPSLPTYLVDMAVRVVPFSRYTSSPLLYSDRDVDSVADEPVGLMEGRRCRRGQRAGGCGAAGGMVRLLELDLERRGAR